MIAGLFNPPKHITILQVFGFSDPRTRSHRGFARCWTEQRRVSSNHVGLPPHDFGKTCGATIGSLWIEDNPYPLLSSLDR